jgi:hypothetical protein
MRFLGLCSSFDFTHNFVLDVLEHGFIYVASRGSNQPALEIPLRISECFLSISTSCKYYSPIDSNFFIGTYGSAVRP